MKTTLIAIILIASSFLISFAEAQTAPFEISLEAVQLEDLGGLQSYAVGQHDGK